MKQKILSILNDNQGTYISGEQISKQLNTSRMNVSKYVKKLIADGYEIHSSTRKGYLLANHNDVLIIDEIQNQLPSFYHTIHIQQSIDSTNDTLKQIAYNQKEGYVLISDEQTRGKGRNGRSFTSTKQKGIYMSILLKPSITIYEALKLTACASVAVYEAIDKVYHISSGIKWVNDIFIENKKIGGILCEASLEMNTANMDYMIVGIGLNVHSQKFDKELHEIAASIEDFTSLKQKRNLLIHQILQSFYKYYNELTHNTFLPIYKQHSIIIDQDIVVHEQDNTYPAHVLDIDENANLIIKKVDGTIHTLNSGEVSIRRIDNNT
ncbi:biotin--[acetyl-CoA-carboxylase] ligase [Breznakia sp. OttesenSCG-928-G09]|nr:biotin--[acetyl-CoA-carboxylase] ligase [Breznakia sp. OttesenSCG-928-G09]